MIPGEIKVKNTEIEINKHHPETVIEVKNTSDFVTIINELMNVKNSSLFNLKINYMKLFSSQI